MPKSSNHPFSKANPLQAEIHSLCLERSIDILSAKGRTRTNSELVAAIRQHEQENPSSVDNTADLFLQSDASPDTSVEPADSSLNEQAIDLSESNDSVNEVITASLDSELIPNSITSDNAGNLLALELPANSKANTSALDELHKSSHSGGLLEYITGDSNAEDLGKASTEFNASPNKYLGPFYLQMQSVNLATYLSRGIIYPIDLEPDLEYIAVRPIDFLSHHRSYLPLTAGRLDNFTEKEVLVELFLRPNEIEHLQAIDSVYRFSEIIPVSRIRHMLFVSTDAITEFRINAEQFKNYFFPKSLIGVIEDNIATIKAEPTQVVDASNLDPILLHQLRQFDRQLGMFGYLKHAPLLRANTEQFVQDFPSELLIGLHEINTAVFAEEGNTWVMNTLLRRGSQEATTAGRKLFAAIVQAIYQDETASYEWGIKLLQRIEAQCRQQPELPRDFIQLQAAQEQLNYLQQGQGNFSKALAAIASSDGIKRDIPPLPFTALVLLCNKPGRARASEDKQAVLINLAQYTNRGLFNAPMLLEQLLAVLGLYYGYAQFTRQDPNLKIESPELDAAAQSLHRLRFDIDLPSDRIIIESVFRYCIEGHPIHDILTYLLPGEVLVSDQLVFPLRVFRVAAANAKATASYYQKPNQPSKSGRDQKPDTFRLRDNEPIAVRAQPRYQQEISATDPAILEDIILKMTRWFSPTHFEQQLLSGFTPAEQEALRLLIQARKAR